MRSIFGDKVTFDHQFGTVTFNDPTMTDWPGAIRCKIDVLDGWKDTAEKNVVRSPRGVGDGDYIGPRWAAKSRMLEIEGYVQAQDRGMMDATFDSIILNAFPEDTDITITLFEPIPKSVIGRVVDIAPTQYLPEGLRWRATVLCANPFKYDALETLEGSAGVAGVSTGGMTLPLTLPLLFNISAQGEGNQVTVFNRGTARTSPYIEIYGPLTTGWRLENITTGNFSAFDLSLSASDILVMDHRIKSATLNGQLVSGLITGDWWSLAPKSNTIRLYGNYDANASFYLYARSHWR